MTRTDAIKSGWLMAEDARPSAELEKTNAYRIVGLWPPIPAPLGSDRWTSASGLRPVIPVGIMGGLLTRSGAVDGGPLRLRLDRVEDDAAPGIGSANLAEFFVGSVVTSILVGDNWARTVGQSSWG
jgi:hypothetical protein